MGKIVTIFLAQCLKPKVINEKPHRLRLCVQILYFTVTNCHEMCENMIEIVTSKRTIATGTAGICASSLFHTETAGIHVNNL